MIETQATVVNDPQGNPASIVVELPETVTSSENSDAVTIAAIEAEKEIAIAEIQADVAVANIEAMTSAVEENKDDITWRLNSLEMRQTEILAKLEVMTAPPVMTVEEPPISLVETETLAEAIAETLPEPNLTDQSTSAPTSEMQMEVSEKSEDEKPEGLTIGLPGKKPIFRLV